MVLSSTKRTQNIDSLTNKTSHYGNMPGLSRSIGLSRRGNPSAKYRGLNIINNPNHNHTHNHNPGILLFSMPMSLSSLLSTMTPTRNGVIAIRHIEDRDSSATQEIFNITGTEVLLTTNIYIHSITCFAAYDSNGLKQIDGLVNQMNVKRIDHETSILQKVHFSDIGVIICQLPVKPYMVGGIPIGNDAYPTSNPFTTIHKFLEINNPTNNNSNNIKIIFTWNGYQIDSIIHHNGNTNELVANTFNITITNSKPNYFSYANNKTVLICDTRQNLWDTNNNNPNILCTLSTATAGNCNNIPRPIKGVSVYAFTTDYNNVKDPIILHW
jgi:hypothetical protein